MRHRPYPAGVPEQLSLNVKLSDPAEPSHCAAVAASAGTGKTYLLVTRIIRLLLAGAHCSSILALTFTRKAAAEMQQRLMQRLQKMALLNEAELDQELAAISVQADPATRQRAMGLYEALLFADNKPRITTFHAFCQDLLHHFPLEADVPAGYELLDNTELVEKVAWDTLCLEATANPDSSISQALQTLFINCNGLSNTRSCLNAFLAQRSDWWAYTEDAKNAVDFASSRLQQHLAMQANPLQNFFSTSRCQQLEQIANQLQLRGNKLDIQHSELLQYGLNQSIDEQDRFKAICEALLTTKQEPRKLKTSKDFAKVIGEQAMHAHITLRNQLAEEALQTLEYLRREQYYSTNQAWYLAGNTLLHHLQNIKQTQGLLDFADLEWRSYQLLNNSNHALWVQYKLDQRINHLLFDEFQDSNPTQWRLILPLLEEMASSNTTRQRSVFLVGDNKQSIYSFRRANPQLQTTASNWLQEKLGAQQYSLSKSRRSAPAIMQFVNQVFDNEEQPSLSSFTTHDTYQQQLWGEVAVLPLLIDSGNNETTQQTLRDPLTTARADEQSNIHYLEGLKIAEHIKDLIQQQRAIALDDQQKPLDYNDIIILMRNRTHAEHYELALRDSDIPYTGIDKGGLLKSLEIQDIEALLMFLVTPFDNLALAQILCSPIISANDHDLQLLKQTPGDNWYQRLCKLTELNDCSNALKRAAQLLPKWRNLVGHLPIHDLLDRIYFEGDIINRYLQNADDASQDTVAANLQHLLELALQIDSGRFPSLTRFINRLQQLRLNVDAAPDTPNIAHAHKKVRLLTIHAAKGLEAPVIYLVDCASNNRKHDAYNAVVDWPADKPRPDLLALQTIRAKQPDVIRNMQQRLHEQQQQEQANLLYVALTRAQHMLIISASAGNENAIAGSWYERLQKSMQCVTTESSAEPNILQTGTIKYGKQATIANTPTETLPLPATGAHQALSTIAPSAGTHAADASAEQRQGIIIHKLLELLSEPNAISQINPDAFVEYGLSTKLLGKCEQQVRQLLRNPDLSFLFNEENYLTAYKEQSIAYKNNAKQTVWGVIDRLVITDSDAWVIDYKSHNVDRSDARQHAQQFHQQLNYYRQGVQLLWPDKQLHCAVLYTQTAQLIELN